MNSLAYLIRSVVKNHILNIIRSPAKLVIALVLLALIVVSIIVSVVFGDQGSTDPGHPLLIKLFVVGFTTMYLLVFTQTATSSGNSIFSMADVNLVFTSPLSPRLVLGYGAVRMMWTSLLGAVSMLFMTVLFNTGVGLEHRSILIAVGVFFVTVCLMGIGSLVAYNLTNGRPFRKRLLRVAVGLCCLPAVIAFIVEVARSGIGAPALYAWLSSPWLAWTPIIGWTSEAGYGLGPGNHLVGLGFLGLILAAMVGLAWWFARAVVDYYEDAVVATETQYEKLRAAQDGEVISLESMSTKAVKIRGTGVGGRGATAFFHKQLREARRASRIGPWGVSSLLVVGIAVVVALALADEGPAIMLTIVTVLCFLQFFIVSTLDRGMTELSLHYIYLVPEPSFAKIVWSNLQSCVKSLGEAVVAYGVAAVILGANPLLVVLGVIVHVGFTAVMTGFLLAVMRLTGVNLSQSIMMFLYSMGVFFVQVPGLVVALIIGSILGGTTGIFVGLATFAAWEVAIAAVCFLVARDCLDRADILTVAAKR